MKFHVSGDRLWFELLREPTRLHVHSEPLLSRPGGDPRCKVRHADRHVEPRLHPGGAGHRFPVAAWRRRGGSAGLYHRAAGHATAALAGIRETAQAVHQLEGLPALLLRHDDVRRVDRVERRFLQERERPRPAGLQESPAGVENLRRPVFPRLHSPLPEMGPGTADDTWQGVETRMAAS